jgi:hypothetical protein
MTQAINEDVARVFSEIPALLHEEVGEETDGVFVYAEFEPGVISLGVYKDFGEKVVSYWASSELSDKLWEAWRAADPDKRWSAVFYTIEEGKFDVRFLYEGDWVEDEEGYTGRLPRILAAKYGNKPIEYPTFDEGQGLEL